MAFTGRYPGWLLRRDPGLNDLNPFGIFPGWLDPRGKTKRRREGIGRTLVRAGQKQKISTKAGDKVRDKVEVGTSSI